MGERSILSVRFRAGPVIIVKDEPFGAGYDVEVVPPPMGVGHDREFSCRNDALTYALGLQKGMGWRLRDLTDDRG